MRIKTAKAKTVALFGILLGLAFALKIGYPIFSDFFTSYRINYYHYEPAHPVISEIETSHLAPATAVPVLMYHGILKNFDSDNTEQNRFIEQLEMLKREGYQSITMQQFYSFWKGEFVLPPKPVVITFDDGRRDSYYPTDDIFKNLGFTATMFVASGKQRQQDPFFLNWRELKRMKDSGRWEIEAHGTYSHDKIKIDDQGNTGKFLTSLRYIRGTGLESISDFEKRVENDYVQNSNDLQQNLETIPTFYAIPLNEYGSRVVSNYSRAGDFNLQMIKKYFKLAFIEGYSGGDPDKYSKIYNLPLYNYRDTNPYFISRLEVKNLTADQLKNLLADSAPRKLPFSLSIEQPDIINQEITVLYGTGDMQADGLHLKSSEEADTAKALFGDNEWKNYEIEAEIKRVTGRSTVLLAYHYNENNYLSFGITDSGLFIRETLMGIEKELAPSVILSEDLKTFHKYKLSITNRSIRAYFDNRLVFDKSITLIPSGRVGLKTWGDNAVGETALKNLTVTPIK